MGGGKRMEPMSSGNKDENEFDVDEDPQYKSFLANLKEDGNFYALQVVGDDGRPLLLNYHYDYFSDDEEKQVADCNRILKSSNMRKSRNKVTHQEKKIDEAYERYLEYMDHDNDVEDGYDSKQLASITTSHHLGKGSPYDQNETSRPSTILLDEDGRQCRIEASNSGCSEFRKKLMEKLKQPYDQGEYNRLWEMLNEEKPKLRHIDLRGDASAKTFPTDKNSDSLLKQYSTLQKKVDAVKSNPHKLLNVMRGFFFWLENVAHEDNFQPWRDEICLQVMPESHESIFPPA